MITIKAEQSVWFHSSVALVGEALRAVKEATMFSWVLTIGNTKKWRGDIDSKLQHLLYSTHDAKVL